MSVDSRTFKDAMARLTASVTVVTAYDEDGRPRGFTASAVCSLSLSPPLVLVCVSRDRASHDVFTTADWFAVNVLRDVHRGLAVRFASPGHDRFAGSGFVWGPHAPRLPDALAVVVCAPHAVYEGGDHTILVGRVDEAISDGGEPLLYFERDFNRLSLVPVA